LENLNLPKDLNVGLTTLRRNVAEADVAVDAKQAILQSNLRKTEIGEKELELSKLEAKAKEYDRRVPSSSSLASQRAKNDAALSVIVKHQKGIDVLFMMDCTGSMSSWIKISQEKIVDIGDEMKKQFPNFNMRVAFIAYRDFGDGAKQLEKRDFNQDLKAVQTFISSMVATGGGDGPEDIAGGLENALKLSWESNTKLLIHFADAPPHGKGKYHEMEDSYPGGDPSGRVPENLAGKLAEKGVDYYFARLNDTCDKMMQLIKKEYSKTNARCEVMDIASATEKFFPSVVESISSSLRESMSRGLTGVDYDVLGRSKAYT